MENTEVDQCEKCNRNLLDKTFDKCMYCGHPMPENQRLSEDAKKEILVEKQQRFEEAEEEHRNRKIRRRDGYDFDGGDYFSGGGDGGCF